MVNAVMGCSGPAPGFVSSLVARMSLIRKRSEGEQRDWEMFTKSKGSGTMTMLSLCWKWINIKVKNFILYKAYLDKNNIMN